MTREFMIRRGMLAGLLSYNVFTWFAFDQSPVRSQSPTIVAVEFAFLYFVGDFINLIDAEPRPLGEPGPLSLLPRLAVANYLAACVFAAAVFPVMVLQLVLT